MRILWMKSDYILPPDTGGKIRTYNLMRELRKLCEVTYLCFRGDESEPDLAIAECASQLESVVRPEERKAGPAFYARVLAGTASRHPYIVQKYRSREILSRAREYFAKKHLVDGEAVVILCDFLEMAENVAWELPCAKVLFQHNVESQIWHQYYMNERNPLKKLYWAHEWRRMERYEAAACNRFDLVFAVSGEDRGSLRNDLQVKSPVEVLPTGVDTEFFSPRPEIDVVPGRLLFLGSLDWMPNIDGIKWFLGEVYPKIRAQSPGVTLDIVGRRPVEAVLRAAAGDESVRVLPDVPDVRPHVAAADLFVVPLRMGGGTRIKIYEAMAMGRPVVSTTLGAQGLGLNPGAQIAIADPAEEFAAAVAHLVRAPSAKNALAEAGYHFVSERCQWKHIAQILHDRCEALSDSYREGWPR